MRYLESKPSPRFARRIRCFWSLEDAPRSTPTSEPVLPDGCLEIVFNLADRFRRFSFTGRPERQPRTLVAGQMTQRIVIGPEGRVKLFGVRFEPAGAFTGFGFPIGGLTDQIVPGDAIWGTRESCLYEQLAEARSFASRIGIFEEFWSDRESAGRPTAHELEYAVEIIGKTSGRTRVADIARGSGWSQRRLERTCSEQLGVTPKVFARIMRFQSLLHELGSGKEHELADVAVKCGFYDQPHMNREFQAIAGTSPLEYLADHHRISDLFTGAK